jgi:hypothetical protein
LIPTVVYFAGMRRDVANSHSFIRGDVSWNVVELKANLA